MTIHVFPRSPSILLTDNITSAGQDGDFAQEMILCIHIFTDEKIRQVSLPDRFCPVIR